MPNGTFTVPYATNEPVFDYAPGSPERENLKKEIAKLKSIQVDLPMIIDGQEVRTGDKKEIRPPHELSHLLGHYHQGNAAHVGQAIEAALQARGDWAAMSWEHRAAIFLKAAELLSGPYRAKMNAATMLGQSKNVFQAEIDAACELADFFRFNVEYLAEIYQEQPESAPGMWNRLEHRPLEGFVFALTPFNFTSIAGNLPSAPAMAGNVAVWKPSKTATYSAAVIMEIFHEAGLPDGVINLVHASGPVAADVVFKHPDFAGIHFTGSTEVFQGIWEQIGENIKNYKTYPRIVGETGGKDYIIAHPTADTGSLVTAISRGAFEYQGQKCSAASRIYIPESLWPDVKTGLEADLKEMKMGSPEDFTNFMNAVIDERSFDKLAGYIERAKGDKQAEVIMGGGCDKTEGYFIEPTLILTTDPKYITMREELFGPVVTIYVYPDTKFNDTLSILNDTSMYGLTGALFCKDRQVIQYASKVLEGTAGNFYINDKPTGAVVGQQPFGGARGSGTNDKAGSMLNMLRWVSPRTIKETFVPPTDYKYPFMDDK